jgi:hypothetical protein
MRKAEAVRLDQRGGVFPSAFDPMKDAGAVCKRRD